jgi:hypothetical protein
MLSADNKLSDIIMLSDSIMLSVILIQFITNNIMLSADNKLLAYIMLSDKLCIVYQLIECYLIMPTDNMFSTDNMLSDKILSVVICMLSDKMLSADITIYLSYQFIPHYHLIHDVII